ncbi:MAG TPA: RodZ domain-containing protein [Gallionella sp.]|nr:RodZ domain-containing protein [Gallionella sp.]
MEQLPENNAEQGNRSAATPQRTLGGMLRQAREHLGLSVADVAAQIKFAPRQIEALEADDFGNLPEAAFLRGFVRSYAKILHLDAQVLLAAMPQVKPAAAELIPASVEVPFPVAYAPQRQTLVLLGAALLLALIVIVFAVWRPLKQSRSVKMETPVALPSEIQTLPEPGVQKHDTVEPPNAAEPKPRTSVTEKQASVRAAKVTSASAVPQTGANVLGTHDTAPARSSKLRLVFDEESWTEITDRDGKIISSQVNPRGSELNLEGRLPLSLVIGHAATTHLYQDGEPVDLTSYTNSSSVVARITLE